MDGTVSYFESLMDAGEALRGIADVNRRRRCGAAMPATWSAEDR